MHLDDPTDKPQFATAYWALCADAMSGAAGTLGYHDDADRWRATAASVRAAWWARHGQEDASLRDASQTSLAMALRARLVPEDARDVVAAQLRTSVLSRGAALTTGIHGTRFLLGALSDTGSLDLAYALLLRREYPSWLYAVDHGATTVWERWDGWTESDGFQTPFMNSLDHYALGSVGEWLHEYVAGLRPGVEGYRTPLIRPYPGGGLTRAQACREVEGGAALAAWQIEDGRFLLSVSSVAGCRVSMPISDAGTIDIPEDAVRVDDSWPTYDLPAGSYTLTGAWDPSWIPSPVTAASRWC